MELQDSILKEFANAVNTQVPASPDSKNVFGTVSRIVDGTIFVRLSGADEGVETPVTTMVEVGLNDKVLVSMKNHSATIIGNISYPSLTRAGSFYVTLTSEGLIVGQVNAQNEPTGQYMILKGNETDIYNEDGVRIARLGSTITLGLPNQPRLNLTSNGMNIVSADGNPLTIIGPDGITLRDALGNVLGAFLNNGITLKSPDGTSSAKFTPTEIDLGTLENAIIKFCNGKGEIKLDGSTLKVSGGNAVGAIGLSNSYTKNGVTYKSEVVCEANTTSQRASMQLLNGNNTISSVLLSDDGVAVNVPASKALTVKTGTGTATEVVKADGVVAVGTVIWNYTSLASARYFTVTATVTVPTGYKLIGINSVRLHGQYPEMWNLIRSEMDSSNRNRFTLRFYTVNDEFVEKPSQVICEWFALRTSGIVAGGDTHIDL